MKQKNKLILTVATLSFLFFSGIFLVHAQEFPPPITPPTLEALIQKFLEALQGIIVLLAIVFIVVGGIMYMTSAGDEKGVERAKITITGAVIGLAIAIGAPTLLNEILTILDVNGTKVGTTATLYDIISRVLNLLLSFIGLLAIIGMVVGGIFYMTSAGDEERIEKGKTIITYSIVGISVALLGLVIVKAVATVIAG